MTQPIRRIVTGHDQTGKAVVVIDSPAPNVKVRKASKFISTLLWKTDETPADISGNADRAEGDSGIAPAPMGSVLRIVDFPPLGEDAAQIDNEAFIREMRNVDPLGKPARHPLMHRTRTLDYVLVLAGEIDMLLDDSEVHVKAGDVLVQQGTIHGWVNRGRENCRIAFVLIDANEPAQLQSMKLA